MKKTTRGLWKLAGAVGKLVARVASELVKDVIAYVRRRKQLVPWPDPGTATTWW